MNLSLLAIAVLRFHRTAKPVDDGCAIYMLHPSGLSARRTAGMTAVTEK